MFGVGLFEMHLSGRKLPAAAAQLPTSFLYKKHEGRKKQLNKKNFLEKKMGAGASAQQGIQQLAFESSKPLDVSDINDLNTARLEIQRLRQTARNYNAHAQALVPVDLDGDGRADVMMSMQHAQQQQQQQIQQQALQQNAAMMQQQLQQQQMQQMQAGAAQQQQYQQQMAAQQQYQQQLQQQQQLQAQQQQQMQAIQQQEQTPQGGSVMGTVAKGVGGVAIMGGVAGGAMLATNPEMMAGAGAIAGDLAGNAGELVGGVGEAAGDLLGGGLGEASGGLVANAGEALSGLGNMLGF